MAIDNEHRPVSLEDLVRDALRTGWDPLGIKDIDEAPDEYESYVPDLCRMLIGHTARHQIATYLWRVETDRMGLKGNRQATEAFADQLLSLFRDLSRGVGR